MDYGTASPGDNAEWQVKEHGLYTKVCLLWGQELNAPSSGYSEWQPVACVTHHVAWHRRCWLCCKLLSVHC